MPLFKSSSKKAFEHNVKEEVESGRPQKQSLAIAYEIKKKNAKKMAKGGPINASDEMEAKADNAKDSIDLDMIDGESTEHDTDQDLRHEPKATADSGEDGMHMMADGGMVDSKSITPEEMEMIRGHRLVHGDEERAGSRRSSADDADDSMAEDMLHQHGERDEYSKEGHINYADGGMIDDGEDGSNDLVESILSRKRNIKQGQVDLGRNADEDLNNEDDLSFKAGRRQNYSEDAALKELSGPSTGNLKGHEADDEHDEDMISAIRARIKAKRGM